MRHINRRRAGGKQDGGFDILFACRKGLPRLRAINTCNASYNGLSTTLQFGIICPDINHQPLIDMAEPRVC